VIFTGCFAKPTSRSAPTIRFLIDSAPASLDPRQSFDAIGQRLEMLAFRGLTTLGPELDPMPDLSEKWRVEDGGKMIVFTLRPGLVDHAGTPITPEREFECIRNFLYSEPKSPLTTNFPTLRGVELVGGEIVFDLTGPDPYFPRNASVLRYFAVAGDPDHPCRSPIAGEHLVTSGEYSVSPYPDRFDREIRMIARAPGTPDLVFELVREETSRLFKLLNGEADVVMNSFSPTKTAWISENGKRGFNLVERNGSNASYLAFNLRDPILRQKKVRLAIAHAIDRAALVKFKVRGMAGIASSFLSPALPEAISDRPFAFDPELSEKLLDEAGFPRGKDGIRFRLKEKTTTNREAIEVVLFFREMLGKVGIAIDIDSVEPSVFFASVRKGNFQIYMSQWVGVADGSIFHRTLRTGVKDNRVGYSSPEVDGWLDRALSEDDFSKRKALLAKVQDRMLEDVPYFPLWHWTNAIVVRDTIVPPTPDTLSLSGSYFPLRSLRFKVSP
jgi:peptide/nickel transport system substrate-binding protein